MRDPEERTRHFVVRGKKDSYYDEPSVGRRKKMSENEEEEQRYFSKAEGSERPGRGFVFSSRSRDDIDMEDDEQRAKAGKIRAQYDEEIDYYEDEERKRAPLLVRVFAWIALIAVLFAAGYIGANYFFSWIDKKGASKGVVYAPDSEAGRSQHGAAVSDIAGSVTYRIYIPDKGGKFIERSIDIDRGLPEEDIAKVLAVYIDGLKEINLMDNGVSVQNVFCSGDWLYLDMTRAFESSIKRIGKDKAAFVITGLVKTMQENFPPIKKVKFYIEGRESSEKSAADLSKPWEITQ